MQVRIVRRRTVESMMRVAISLRLLTHREPEVGLATSSERTCLGNIRSDLDVANKNVEGDQNPCARVCLV